MKNLLMAVKFLFKSLIGRKSYLFVLIAAVALGISLVAALVSISLDLGEKVGGTLRSYGANVILVPKQQIPVGDNAYINETDLKKLKSKPPEYLAGYSPYLYGTAKINKQEVRLSGVDPRLARKLTPWWQLEGSWIKSDNKSDNKNEIVIGVDLAKQLNLRIGSKLKINPLSIEKTKTENQQSPLPCLSCHRALSSGHSDRIKITKNINCSNCHKPHGEKQLLSGKYKIFTVKGIVRGGGVEDEQIFISLSNARSLFNLPNLLSEIQVSVLTNRLSSDEAGKRLELLIPGTKAKIIKQIASAETGLLKKIQLLMILVTSLILTASMLSVSSTMTVNIMQRSREIGLMKALGATSAGITGPLLVEIVIIGLTGGLVGWFLGFIFAQIIGRNVFGFYISFQPIVVIVSLIVALIVTLAPSILPIRRALKTKPAITLRGE